MAHVDREDRRGWPAPTSEFEIAFCGEADQAVLVTEIDEELLQGLNQTHVVDIDRKTLTKRQ
jgi:hypothetical protein